MPLDVLHIGPFAAIYVGVYGATSTPLTQFTISTTGSHKVSYNVPEAFSFWDSNSIQSGPASIRADLTFLSDDPNTVRLANGNWITETYADQASSFSKYVLLLIHPDDEAESSILIPQCYTVKNLALDNTKSAPTTVPLAFTFQDVNRFNKLYYKRSAAALATILGAASPI